jgi:hypothetical protein
MRLFVIRRSVPIPVTALVAPNNSIACVNKYMECLKQQVPLKYYCLFGSGERHVS